MIWRADIKGLHVMAPVRREGEHINFVFFSKLQCFNREVAFIVVKNQQRFWNKMFKPVGKCIHPSTWVDQCQSARRRALVYAQFEYLPRKDHYRQNKRTHTIDKESRSNQYASFATCDSINLFYSFLSYDFSWCLHCCSSRFIKVSYPGTIGKFRLTS